MRPSVDCVFVVDSVSRVNNRVVYSRSVARLGALSLSLSYLRRNKSFQTDDVTDMMHAMRTASKQIVFRWAQAR